MSKMLDKTSRLSGCPTVYRTQESTDFLQTFCGKSSAVLMILRNFSRRSTTTTDCCVSPLFPLPPSFLFRVRESELRPCSPRLPPHVCGLIDSGRPRPAAQTKGTKKGHALLRMRAQQRKKMSAGNASLKGARAMPVSVLRLGPNSGQIKPMTPRE